MYTATKVPALDLQSKDLLNHCKHSVHNRFDRSLSWQKVCTLNTNAKTRQG